MTQTTTADENSTTIFDGAECPAFVAEAALENTPDDHTHRATFANPNTAHMDTTEPAVARLVVDLDGGVIVYEDAANTHRRVFDDPDDATAAFVSLVESTARDYDRQGLAYELDYSPGTEPLTFDV